MLKKNTAGQFIYFVLIQLSDGTVHTGQSPNGYVSKDGAAQGGIGGSIAATANGQYKVSLSQGDTNGDEIGYLFTNSGSVAVSITVTTETKKMADLNDFAAGDAVNLSANAIKKVSYDESTAWPLLAADTGSTQVARVGADGDTLETLSDEIAALPTDADVNTQCDLALTDIHLDHLLAVDFDADIPVGHTTSFLRQLMEVDSSLIRLTEASLANSAAAGGDASAANQTLILEDLVDIKGTSFTKDTDSLVDLAHIGADGDTLEDLSDEIALIAGDATSAKQDEILVDLVDIKGTAFSKDTHSLVDMCLLTTLATHDTKLDTVDGIVDAILIDTGTTLDGIVDAILVDTGTTLPATLSTIDGKVDTISTAVVTTLDDELAVVDGIVDDIKKLLRGDFVVDENETPYEYLILEEGTANVLVTKELYEVDDTNITTLTQVVGKMLKP